MQVLQGMQGMQGRASSLGKHAHAQRQETKADADEDERAFSPDFTTERTDAESKKKKNERDDKVPVTMMRLNPRRYSVYSLTFVPAK
jgi:hypothetical protein